jgi:hypothetical protein
MTDEIPDPGVLGRPAADRVDDHDFEPTTLALAALLDNGTTADAVQFGLGALDVACAIAAAIIGRGIVEPSAFQVDVTRFAKHWRSKGHGNRALASELMGERLKTIEQAKLKAKAHLVLPEGQRAN